jgi:hypothetical protein
MGCKRDDREGVFFLSLSCHNSLFFSFFFSVSSFLDSFLLGITKEVGGFFIALAALLYCIRMRFLDFILLAFFPCYCILSPRRT